MVVVDSQGKFTLYSKFVGKLVKDFNQGSDIIRFEFL